MLPTSPTKTIRQLLSLLGLGLCLGTLLYVIDKRRGGSSSEVNRVLLMNPSVEAIGDPSRSISSADQVALQSALKDYLECFCEAAVTLAPEASQGAHPLVPLHDGVMLQVFPQREGLHLRISLRRHAAWARIAGAFDRKAVSPLHAHRPHRDSHAGAQRGSGADHRLDRGHG